MTPESVINWSCVVIFIITAILTLLHVSGIRPLRDPHHGKILFRILIVEIVVIAVAVFGNTFLPQEVKLEGAGIIGPSSTSDGIDIPSAVGDGRNMPSVDVNTENPEVILLQQAAKPIEGQLGKDCREITVFDSSTYPPTSRIEINCNDN